MKKEICGRIFKLLLLFAGSYLLIQLSNQAKRLDELDGIPGLETKYDVAAEYLTERYQHDWYKLMGSILFASDKLLDANNLKFDTDIGEVYIRRWSKDECSVHMFWEMNAHIYIIHTYYHFTDIELTNPEDEEWTSYTIEYDSDSAAYLSNVEMEDATGLKTSEVVDVAQKMRDAFEEKVQKMHAYEIEQPAIRRQKYTNVAYLLLLLLLFLILLCKLLQAAWRSKKEQIPFKQSAAEEVERTLASLWKKRYFLLGIGTTFWIYILKEIISYYLLFWADDTVREYLAYAISAIPVAAVSFWAMSALKKCGAEEAAQKIRLVRMLPNILHILPDGILLLLLLIIGIWVSGNYGVFYWIMILAEFLTCVIGAISIVVASFFAISALKKRIAGDTVQREKPTKKKDKRCIHPLLKLVNYMMAAGIIMTGVVVLQPFEAKEWVRNRQRADHELSEEQIRPVRILSNVLHVLFSCILMMLLLRIGIRLVSHYYPASWSFYKINLLADCLSLCLLGILIWMAERKKQ